MQARFRLAHRIDDLALAADVAIDQASCSSKHTLAMCSVDLAKAFDSVPRAKLLSVPREHCGIDYNLVEVIRSMYTGATGQVAGASNSFHMDAGVKQGCPMSPLLFGLLFDYVVQFVKQQLPPDVCGNAAIVAGVALQLELYADDLALFAPNPTALQAYLHSVAQF